MPLTYQPFAEIPPLETTPRDPRMNISDQERVLSGVGGACMVAAGLIFRGWSGVFLIGLGAAFGLRGWTGHCPINEKLEIDNRNSEQAPSKNGEQEIENALAAH